MTTTTTTNALNLLTFKDALETARREYFDVAGPFGQLFLDVGTKVLDNVYPANGHRLREVGTLDNMEWMSPRAYYDMLSLFAGLAHYYITHTQVDVNELGPCFTKDKAPVVEQAIKAYWEGIGKSVPVDDARAPELNPDMIAHIVHFTCSAPSAPTTDSANPKPDEVVGGQRPAYRLATEAEMKDHEGRAQRASEEPVIPTIVAALLDLAETYPEDAVFIMKTVSRYLDKAADKMESRR